jgi:hypothetical protein
LVDENVTNTILKLTMVERFSDKLPDSYQYNLLHEAIQGKDESPIQFSDRCRILSAKTIRKTRTQ